MYKLTTYYQHEGKKRSWTFENLTLAQNELTKQLTNNVAICKSENYNIITTRGENRMTADMIAFKPNTPDISIIWIIESLEEN